MTASITDFAQFQTLRASVARDDPAAIREAAGQFEALFVQTLLKNMRSASLADPIFGQSDQHEMYQEMLDKQLSLEMSSGPRHRSRRYARATTGRRGYRNSGRCPLAWPDDATKSDQGQPGTRMASCWRFRTRSLAACPAHGGAAKCCARGDSGTGGAGDRLGTTRYAARRRHKQ